MRSLFAAVVRLSGVQGAVTHAYALSANDAASCHSHENDWHASDSSPPD
ncbi:MAG: hypothetical protein H0X24_08015 [Ktedonobacterales bacterium]|nr:hypothetical protein [Ktedonobacterales bacterium]